MTQKQKKKDNFQLQEMKTGKEQTYMKTEKTQKNKINKRLEQSNEITKRKTRQSKKIKNALTNFKIFYQNIR